MGAHTINTHVTLARNKSCIGNDNFCTPAKKEEEILQSIK